MFFLGWVGLGWIGGCKKIEILFQRCNVCAGLTANHIPAFQRSNVPTFQMTTARATVTTTNAAVWYHDALEAVDAVDGNSGCCVWPSWWAALCAYRDNKCDKTDRYIYFRDTNGVKMRVDRNPTTRQFASDFPNDDEALIMCEPWCTSCGHSPHMCHEYFTRCTGTKLGRWFDEEQGVWNE